LKKHVDYYKLERISSRMVKEFGTIPKGDEELYCFMLHPMEGNLLKLHRKVPARNGRNAIDAIHICLLKIDEYINKIEYDFSRFINDENRAFLQGLLESFDPFTNREIFDAASKTYDLNTSDDLKKLYKNPVKCLLRIEKSIELWTKEIGANGYFEIIEDQIGHTIDNDEKMNYTMMLKGRDDFEKLGIDASSLGKYFPEDSDNAV